MYTTTVGIKGTFDIAIARNLVRSQVATNRKLKPSMMVRATIALTALGELIIGMQVQKAVPVKLQFIEHDDRSYMEYSCLVPNSPINNETSNRYQLNLERVSHYLNIRAQGTNLQVEGDVQLDGDDTL